MTIASNLSDIDRTLTNNMPAQGPGSVAVNDQFAEANRPTVDDRSRRGVEAGNRCNDIVAFSRLVLREARVATKLFRAEETSRVELRLNRRLDPAFPDCFNEGAMVDFRLIGVLDCKFADRIVEYFARAHVPGYHRRIT
jgi:hypothetical protein